MVRPAVHPRTARDLIELALRAPLTADSLQESIGYDLSVTGVTPKLFLPGMSGLMQGPGFPNLSCLGMLSDRVLGATYPQSSGQQHLERALDANFARRVAG